MKKIAGGQAGRTGFTVSDLCSVVLAPFVQVIDTADDFGGGRVIGRDISENGNEDEPSSRRSRRGRSRLGPLE